MTNNPQSLLKASLALSTALAIILSANSRAQAQAENAMQQSEVGIQQPAQSKQAEDVSDDTDLVAEKPSGQDANERDTIVVTGTHIRDGVAAGANVQIYTREDIDRSGFATVHEFMSTIPQNFSGSGASEDPSPGAFRASNHFKGAGVDIRGLGPDSTLVLVNGRRTAPSGLSGDFVDVSTIPQSAIARVEILTDGASALYGSDAVGGVVNFILRKDFEGAETRLRYGRVTDGDTDEYRFSQTFGTNWNNGHILATYEYYRRDALRLSDRDFTRTFDLRSKGGKDYRLLMGNPGNILDPFTFEPTYAIPRNQNGRNLTINDLLPGQINYLDVTKNETLLPKQKRHSGYLTAEQALAENISVFGEVRYSERKFKSVARPLTITEFVPETNVFYPDGFENSPLYAQMNLGPDTGPASETGQVRTLAATGGITASLSDWRLQAYANFGEEKSNNSMPTLDYEAIAAALLDPNPETALNLFGDGKVNNPQTIQKLLASLDIHARSRIRMANIILDGPLFSIRGRSVSLAVGGEYRWQQLRQETFSPPATVPDKETLSRNIEAAFAELYIPLFAPDDQIPFISSLDVSVATRYDNYSDTRSSTNPKVGIQYEPFSGLRLNATYGTSFRAPNLSELSTVNNVSFSDNVLDPHSPTQRSNVLFVYGNDPDTTPETATIWTFGFLIKHPQFSRFSASLNYSTIDFKGRITAIEDSSELLLTFQERYPGIVIRNPDAALLKRFCTENRLIGDPSTCTPDFFDVLIDQRSRNVAKTNIQTLDGLITYGFDAANVQILLNTSATYILEHSIKQTTGTPALERKGTYGYPVDFKARSSLSVYFSGISGFLAINYTDSYKNPVSENNKKIDSFTTFDLNIGLSFNGFLRRNPEGLHQLSLNIVNLFDVDPPFVDSFIAYDGANADPLGRFVALELKVRW